MAEAPGFLDACCRPVVCFHLVDERFEFGVSRIVVHHALCVLGDDGLGGILFVSPLVDVDGWECEGVCRFGCCWLFDVVVVIVVVGVVFVPFLWGIVVGVFVIV